MGQSAVQIRRLTVNRQPRNPEPLHVSEIDWGRLEPVDSVFEEGNA